ncbi:hypothetical protein [Paraburkholderia sp. BCC1884]|uniref:hypothetical protein n=1 Tax=Paraburkholderia sp. BCC1884 TaxID=2562668 RepID=UPI001181D624|nr:hypothetical protein [Paraburkholderia sp. BCC1884]
MKKSEKNRAIHSVNHFRGHYRSTWQRGHLKPQNFPRIEDVATQYYRTPTSEFQMTRAAEVVRGGLSAQASAPHGHGRNVLF